MTSHDETEPSEDPDISPRRSDGEETHERILEAAMRLASVEGLGNLTIGRLARELDLSKSGVFAHFRSKRRLEDETIAAAGEVFEREVLEPGLAAPDGLARLEALCEAYLSYVERGVFPGGCFFAHLLAEVDAARGPVHDKVVEIQRGWLGLLERLIETAKARNELGSGTDAGQLAFELHAALELANYLSILNRDPSIVERGRVAVRARLASAGGSESAGGVLPPAAPTRLLPPRPGSYLRGVAVRPGTR